MGTAGAGHPWWQTAVVEQLYPRSFADSNGDGVGDLEGIRRHLDHLSWLGVDAIWLSPFFRSPMADFGYDVSDYCDVDPLFGTLADFDALLADAHARGLKVLIDWVPNHTSDRHPWFVESRSSRDNPKRDWYIWRDPAPDGGPPNNWIAAFTDGHRRGPSTTTTGQYYLHLFLPEQPDLNWRNPEVVEAMHDTLRFWLDRGVDGFRMDVIHGIVKEPTSPTSQEGFVQMVDESRFDPPAIHARLREIRKLLDSYPGDRVSVGEVYILSTAKVATYYGDGRRAAPRVQLPAAVRAVGREQVAHPDRARAAGARPSGRVADVGAVEPRQPTAPHALRLRSPSPRRRGAAAHVAGHAVPLPGRGARARGRRRAAGSRGRPGRPRRLPRADPVDDRAAARMGRTRDRGCRSRRHRASDRSRP